MKYFLIALLLMGCVDDEKTLPEIKTDSYNYDSIKKELNIEDSINTRRLQDLGSAKMMELDEETKCNLTKVRYVLNKIITDSSNVDFIAHYLGNKILQSLKKQTDCIYPVMCLIYFYMNNKDYKIGDNIASFTFTPTYGVEVFVNTRKLKDFEK